MSIPAGTVLLVTAAGVLIYSGFTSQNPLSALKELASGNPSSVRNEASVDPASFSSTGGVTGNGTTGGIANVSYTDSVPGEGLPALPKACEHYAGDRYSQAKRWQVGYSDCSSFVGKGLKLLGVKPPSGSTTGSYLASRDWKRVHADDVQAGDVAISTTHMAVCYDNGYGIGQQNPRRNVQRGKISDLMAGSGGYIFIRYVSGTGKPRTAYT